MAVEKLGEAPPVRHRPGQAGNHAGKPPVRPLATRRSRAKWRRKTSSERAARFFCACLQVVTTSS